jgi:hypothetical protein
MNERRLALESSGSSRRPSTTFPVLQEVPRNFPLARSQCAIYGFPVHNGGQHLRFQDLVSGYFHNVLREHDVIGPFARNDRTQDIVCERGVSGIDCYS